MGGDLPACALACGGKGGSGAGASAPVTRARGQEVGGEASCGAAAPGRGSERAAPRPSLPPSTSREGPGAARPRFSPPARLVSRPSGPGRAREAGRPGVFWCRLPRCVGGDPGARGPGSPASAPGGQEEVTADGLWPSDGTLRRPSAGPFVQPVRCGISSVGGPFRAFAFAASRPAPLGKAGQVSLGSERRRWMLQRCPQAGIGPGDRRNPRGSLARLPLNVEGTLGKRVKLNSYFLEEVKVCEGPR